MIKFKLQNRFSGLAAGQSAKKASARSGIIYQLELRCREKLVLSVNTSTLKETTRIGKAADNDWLVPETDGSCADHHAKLVLTPKGVEIVAEEGNSLYYHGEQITRHLLRKNDRIAIGDSELHVKQSQLTQNACDVHRLEFLGGERDGEMVRLEKSPFRIGSAPDNDLVLASDVVSYHHAEIRITANGETWLKDLRSSNGTLVNGERLGVQERMLMDSDEISMAQYDFQFLDRNVVHTRTQFGKKLLVMGITVLMVLLGFGGFYLSSPSTEKVINAVDFYLFRDQFDAAERMLAKMPDSRGFQRYEDLYRNYLIRIPHCRKAYATLLEFQDNLKNSRWNDAAECVGRLDLTNTQVWDPANPKTAGRVAAINQSKKLLDALLNLRTCNSSSYNTKTEKRKLWKNLIPNRNTWRAAAVKAPDYQKPLYKELVAMLDELDNNVKVLDQIDQRGADLIASRNLDDMVAYYHFLQQSQKTVTGLVRVYIRDLIFMLDVFRGHLAELHRNDLALFDLRMDDVKPIFFISADECMKFPHLYQLRLQMEEHYRKQLAAQRNWTGIQRQLRHYTLIPGRIPEEIVFFSNEKQIDRILDLPEFMNASKRSTGEYDRVFGERYFYEVIQQTVHSTNNSYGSDLVPDMKTVPKCVMLKDLYRGLTDALLWMELPRNQWLIQGKMKEIHEYYHQLLSTRSTILQTFENIAARSKNTRKYYLARTAYFFVAPGTPDIPEKMRSFAAEWRKFRLTQQNLLSRYNPLDSKGSRQVREAILANGIPGDPIFNWMRSLR